ncbi:hypothetical protein [Luteolibacter soli]|uniref:NgoFVII family restriction endonuclease n=1 Tax=Luteolibacter soli TaxID=3135280 RepID=A0ABU9AS19_9BACT
MNSISKNSPMSLRATVLFDTPQHELASLLRKKIASSTKTQIVAGFATVEGMAAIEGALSANPLTLDTFIVGAGTYRAYEAFDRLINLSIPQDRLFVHLGHTRLTGNQATYRFYRYHPMLHSKVYYMEHENGTASAVIGSHNVTGFALMGLNGEAAVLLEGPKDDPEFDKIRGHINAAKAESLQYAPQMKLAFSWWTHQFVEGLADKANDAPREGENKTTIVILCESKDRRLPKRKESIYFELRSALGKVKSLRAEVHLYVFDSLPASPLEALANRSQARASFWCRPIGVEEEQGGVELLAEWQLNDDRHPILKPTSKPFRPKPTPDMQQVRVVVYNEVRGDFEYLFDPPELGWVPRVDQERSVQVPADFAETLAPLEIIPSEDQPWFLVQGLSRAERQKDDRYLKALDDMSPSAGSYFLMSLRRKDQSPDEDEPKSRGRRKK